MENVTRNESTEATQKVWRDVERGASRAPDYGRTQVREQLAAKRAAEQQVARPGAQSTPRQRT